MHSSMRALGAATLFVTAAAGPLASQPAPQKFAYVDSRKILDQAPGRTDAEAVLQREYAGLQEQLKKMNDAVIKAFGDYQALPVTTPQADKDKRLKAVQDKQAELQQKQQEFDAQLTAHKDELMQPILDQIKIVLEDLRVEGVYTFIFDAGAGASIVAADKNLDISDRVVAKLRTMPKPVIAAKSDSSKTKPSGAPLNTPAGVKPPGTGVTPPPKKPDSTATPKKPDAGAKQPQDGLTMGAKPSGA